MQQPQSIVPYLTQLEHLAQDHGTTVPAACKAAGISTSVYYRARNGAHITFPVAQRIANAIKRNRRKANGSKPNAAQPEIPA